MITVRERERIGTLTDLSVLFRMMTTYRVPMMVKNAIIFEHWPVDNIYYRCPRCQKLLEREFMGYCSYCGQCLDWSGYKKAKRVYYKSK